MGAEGAYEYIQWPGPRCAPALSGPPPAPALPGSALLYRGVQGVAAAAGHGKGSHG